MISNPDYPIPYKTTRSDAVLDEEIAAALIRNDGLQYIAARELGITAQTMSERVKQSPYLQAIKEDCKQHRIDIAEKSLTKMTREDNLGSVCFTLKTIGKDRGYTEDIKQMVSQEVANQYQDIMKQLSSIRDSSEQQQ